MEDDAVDRIVAQWQRERPDLDPSPMEVIGRISRLAQHFEQAIARELRQFGLAPGEFDVLATLRRAGAPYTMTPTLLFRTLMLSSGAMTNRIDRLEKAGLVERCPDPADRRGTLVRLTEQGLLVVDHAVEAHVRNEQRLLASLAPEQRNQLVPILRQLLQDFEAVPEEQPLP